jgi:histidyl-tRNA synthetase
LGVDELKEGFVTIKEQKWEVQEGKKVKIESIDKGIKVRREELAQWLKATPTFSEWAGGK